MTYPYQPGPSDPVPPPPDPPVQPYQQPTYYQQQQQPQPTYPESGYPPPSYPESGYPPPGHAASGYPPPSYGKQNYAQPGYAQPYPYQAGRPTEGLAIAALIVSCAAVLGICAYGVGGVLGVVGAALGHAARRRIARNGTDGAGMALAGIIVGWIMAGLSVIAIVLLVLFFVAGPGITTT
jgi:hypothetical protein